MGTLGTLGKTAAVLLTATLASFSFQPQSHLGSAGARDAAAIGPDPALAHPLPVAWARFHPTPDAAERNAAEERALIEAAASPTEETAAMTPEAEPPPSAAAATPEAAVPATRRPAGAAAAAAPAAPAAPPLVIGSNQHSLINADRAAAGLGPLNWSSCLAGIAQQNANRIAAQGSLSHGDGPSRDLGCGLGSAQGGENIGFCSTGISDGQLNGAFMNSPEHHVNIMGPYHYVGTAWVTAPNGYGYVAVEFA